MRLVLLAAVLANSVDLEGMTGRQEVIFAADFLLQLIDFGGEKLNRTSAIGAHHVVMATPVVLMFVAGDAIVESDFAGQTALGQELKSAVDGGVSDAGVFLLDQTMEFVGREVVASLKKSTQDSVALGGLFKANAFQMAVKNLLRLADHLAGKSGLIVDALLEHWLSESEYHRCILKMKFIFIRVPDASWHTIRDSRMSTMAEIRTPTDRRSPVPRFILWLLLVVVLLAAAVVGYAYYAAQSALPQLDGSLQVSGLSGPVTVTRDAHGVPTIEASTLDDLFFAQGYVTAQDRLWKMDVMRRFAGGELSEILGVSTVKLDRRAEDSGTARRGKEEPGGGVAAGPQFLRSLRTRCECLHRDAWQQLPIEFRILGYTPRPWTPEDSVVIANQMVKDLNYHYFYDALAREKILAKLGPELTADLYVNRSWHDRPPTVMREDVSAPEKTPKDSEDDDEEDDPDNSVTEERVPPNSMDFPALDPAVNGSNDWVVSGAHTVTGKPLLSNDMHLGHQMPNLWYEAHLHSGNFDVAGVTLPGMPYVIVGHNQRVAWGFTNVGPTVTDIFIENFNSQGAYQTPSGWVQPEHRNEVIHVKGKPDVDLDVKITRHGPIITELVPGETRPVGIALDAV